jgi:hypothetical protein
VATTVNTAGMAIENAAVAIGALGCFARTINGNLPVLVSCAHVLFGGAQFLTNVCISRQSSSSACLFRSIGRTLNAWGDGFGGVANTLTDTNTGEQVTVTGSDTDCAIARLDPGAVFSNEFPVNSQMGMVQGTPPPGQLGLTLWLPSQAPSPAQIVRMYSPVSQSMVEGMVVALRFSNMIARHFDGTQIPDLVYPWVIEPQQPDTQPLVNQLLILPRAPAPVFAQPSGGDSGSVVLNHLDQVIGLLVGGMPIGRVPQVLEAPDNPGSPPRAGFAHATHMSFASPIEPVLARLNITIPPGLSGTVPSAGRRIHVVVSRSGFDVHGDELQEPIHRIRRELSTLRLGRVLMEKHARHRREMRRILSTFRHASATWRRAQGPAFVSHGARQLLDPSHALPTVINGVDRGRLIEQMAAVFRAYGSPALRRDVERYLPLIRKLAVDLTYVHELPMLLRQLRAPSRAS